MIIEMFLRGWENFLARLDGPLHFRFFLQPTMAIIMAVRAGLNDAREGRPAFLRTAFSNVGHRRELLRSGWKDTRNVFLLSVILDIIYQIVVHRSVYPLELLFTAVLLALVPYFVLRGPVNRVARMFFNRSMGEFDKDVRRENPNTNHE
jgi:hypothetical protein